MGRACRSRRSQGSREKGLGRVLALLHCATPSPADTSQAHQTPNPSQGVGSESCTPSAAPLTHAPPTAPHPPRPIRPPPSPPPLTPAAPLTWVCHGRKPHESCHPLPRAQVPVAEGRPRVGQLLAARDVVSRPRQRHQLRHDVGTRGGGAVAWDGWGGGGGRGGRGGQVREGGWLCAVPTCCTLGTHAPARSPRAAAARSRHAHNLGPTPGHAKAAPNYDIPCALLTQKHTLTHIHARTHTHTHTHARTHTHTRTRTTHTRTRTCTHMHMAIQRSVAVSISK